MVYVSAKFDEIMHNGLVSTVFTRLFPYMSIVTLTFDLTSKINRVHPLIILNMTAKLDEEAHNGLVSIVFTRSNRDGHTDGRNHSSVTISPLQNIAWG